MKALLVAVALIVVAIARTIAEGHGTSMTVGVVDGALIVGAGLPDDRGFAPLLFADDNENTPLVPFAGSTVVRTTLPGFHVSGMSFGDELFMEILARRDFSVATEEPRWLWYWNPTTQQVESTPGDRTMRIASTDAASQTTLSQSSAPTSAMVRLAQFDVGDFEDDRHFLDYRVANQPTVAPAGAYGFFARLTAPGYLPSEPFLMAFNRSLDGEVFQQGAKIINAAARLPGDFDKDDDADGADFLGWQRTFGSTTALAADWALNDAVDGADLAKWRTNFGRVLAAGVPASSSVPEPATWWGLVLGAAGIGVLRRRFQSGDSQAALRHCT